MALVAFVNFVVLVSSVVLVHFVVLLCFVSLVDSVDALLEWVADFVGAVVRAVVRAVGFVKVVGNFWHLKIFVHFVG